MSSWQQQRENCASFVTDFLMPDEEFPDAWKASLVFFGLAGVLLVVTCIAAVLSICVQTVCGKSIFTVSGLLQSIAGELKGEGERGVVLVLVVTCIAAVLTVCVQTVCGKSIFTVSDLLQSIAGELKGEG